MSKPQKTAQEEHKNYNPLPENNNNLVVVRFVRSEATGERMSYTGNMFKTNKKTNKYSDKIDEYRSFYSCKKLWRIENVFSRVLNFIINDRLLSN